MKKIFYLFFCFLFLVSFKLAYAQEEIPAPTPQVEYQLPYPGLLPDNPLYFLKTLRDRIIGFLISDPLKKAEFNLLSADKGLAAGYALFNKYHGREDLVYSTVVKGENYFESAIKESSVAKKQGIPVQSILNKLYVSSKKHREVIRELEGEVDPNKKEEFAKLEKRVASFENKVSELRAK